MNKFLLITLITSITLLACNENNNEEQGSKSGKIIEMEVVKTSSDTLAEIPMKVSDLSEEELKDDSLFVDGSVPTSWDIAGVTDIKGLKLFIKQLQQWVINNDKENLAAVVKYPLNKRIKTKENLVANYDAVFTKEIKLSFATLDFSQLFRNAKGVMLDGGKVWLGQQGKDFKIIAINYLAIR